MCVCVCVCVQALDTVKQRLEETEGPDMKEQMQDQIRQWFIETRYITCTMCSEKQCPAVLLVHTSLTGAIVVAVSCAEMPLASFQTILMKRKVGQRLFSRKEKNQ